MSMANFFGSAAFISSFLLVTSPIPSIYEGYNKGEISNLNVEYLLIGCVQSSLWMLYGYKLNDFYTFLTNVICVTLFLIYVNLYLWINKQNDKILKYNAIAIGSVSFFTVAFNGNICLLIGAIISTLWHFTIIEKMKQSIQTKDASFINLTVAGVSWLNFFLWLIYAILTENYLMCIPNVVGVIIWGLNLLIYSWANSYISHDNFIINSLALVLKVEPKQSEINIKTPGEPLLNLRTSTPNNANF
jgi:uncharacterized protein with PQ loop repeat